VLLDRSFHLSIHLSVMLSIHLYERALLCTRSCCSIPAVVLAFSYMGRTQRLSSLVHHCTAIVKYCDSINPSFSVVISANLPITTTTTAVTVVDILL